jgi:hypothetical protein
MGSHKIDWCLRVWAIIRFGQEYTASQLYTIMLRGPWGLRGAPGSVRSFAQKLAHSRHFIKTKRHVKISYSHSQRNIYRKRRLW